jgi:iron complex transport system substrate-binding protein
MTLRIVSLCPSITETIFALGQGDALVGRTKFCVRPSPEVAAIERVGGTKNPKIDRIVALQPDLVLMNEEENRHEDADALAHAGLHVLSTFVKSVSEAAQTIVQIGNAIGAAVESRRLCGEIDAHSRELARRVEKRPRVRFAYLIWRRPWMAVAPGTYIDALLRLAGGENVVPSSDARYPEVDSAVLAQADRILLASEPFPFAEKHLFEAATEMQLPRDRFLLADGELLSWHGVRTLAGIQYAEQILR